ncbi:hypothetical protein EIP91_000817 [Steccherinum ochraceum]|uniref:F-box domain-containing protein n=1 Tax=Steccherinum ochraceum TaxID=92696 RepID=A0A4R0RJ43_9APHY|nr:hypothetical protein EIP91_000817 [Steccherinum ochraceum]
MAERSQHPSILSLPIELFAAICRLVTEDNMAMSIFGKGWLDPKTIWVRTTTLCSVCRYFRDVVLNTPTFWRNVQFSEHASDTRTRKLLLKRSAQTPLRVVAIDAPGYGLCQSSAERIGQEILKELHRTEVLQCRFIGTAKCAVLNSSKDLILRELFVTGHTQVSEGARIPFVPCTSPLSRLERLECNFVHHSVVLGFMRPTLKSISLSSLNKPTPLNVFQLLDMLSGTPQLAKLRIDEMVGFMPPYDSKRTPVTLSHLHSLDWRSDFDSGSTFLDHIVVPPTLLLSSHFNVRGFPGKQSPHPQGGFSKIVTTVLSKFRGHGLTGSLPRIETFRIDKDIQLLTLTAADNAGSFTATARLAFARYYSADTVLNVLATLDFKNFAAGLDDIAVLFMQDERDEDETFPASFFATPSPTPNLHTLSLCGAKHIWDGFASCHAALDDGRAKELPLPQLYWLSLCHVRLRSSLEIDTSSDDKEKETLGALRDMLRIRKESGSPLYSLRLNNAYDFNDQAKSMLCPYVTKLDLKEDARLEDVDDGAEDSESTGESSGESDDDRND